MVLRQQAAVIRYLTNPDHVLDNGPHWRLFIRQYTLDERARTFGCQYVEVSPGEWCHSLAHAPRALIRDMQLPSVVYLLFILGAYALQHGHHGTVEDGRLILYCLDNHPQIRTKDSERILFALI